ncbi:MAG: PepSY domain-containing protein [Beijerinckiaceae bacterium]
MLEADLRRSDDGGWQYEILVLSSDGRYREVTVDARRNRIIQIRRR